ncbi:2Fe-2S iron-sulfur cluster-binding protein [Leisingera thetidis]|uniref:2Fe-2S iron-sulfur cluster-binding protein n=1 Tax=Leisingera thetidis TaxID=2930199 RepID=UPI0021F7188A|nr:2Fe-2S iron-sulfur cluster-binding protein [Leisingera thetidis]
MAANFRRFRVFRKKRESDSITSFELVPIDGGQLARFRPGQHLTLKIPGADGEIARNYSLSGDANRTDLYRLTIKRETASPTVPGARDGIGSCYMHDQLNEGDEITATGPRGDFLLDLESTRPVILLSGGVGLTPVVSMLHSLAAAGRPAWFIHACDSGAHHALRDEVLRLAEAENVEVRFAYRSPTEEDRTANAFHFEGMITRDILRNLLPLDDYEVYMCGPVPFMRAMYQILQSLGVAKDCINYEFFGDARTLEDANGAAPSPPVKAAAVPDRSNGAVSDGIPVTFAKSGVSVVWDGTSDSLLDLAERSGLEPEFSCRTGICNTCLCDISAGEVEYTEDPLDDPEPGQVLLCCSKPRGPVVLDI